MMDWDNITQTGARASGVVVSGRREIRHAVRKMKEGPSEPPCRRRLQTDRSSLGQFGASSYKAAPKGLPSSFVQHDEFLVFLTQLPQRPSLRSGLCCPSPSSLMRPHASHSQAHRDFTAVRLIPDACAVPVSLGDPGVVPCFRYPFCLDMSPSATPGSSTAAYTQFLRRQRWPSSRGKRLGTSNIPTIRFPWGAHFGALLRFTCVTTCRVVCSLGGSDPASVLGQRGLLLPGFR